VLQALEIISSVQRAPEQLAQDAAQEVNKLEAPGEANMRVGVAAEQRVRLVSGPGSSDAQAAGAQAGEISAAEPIHLALPLNPPA